MITLLVHRVARYCRDIALFWCFRPDKCPISYWGNYCGERKYMAREMVKHWREFHKIEDLTESISFKGNVFGYRHLLILSSLGFGNST
jgi:hypothetical protein